jgi:hypothetical protein
VTATFLYAVQDATGRELLAWTGQPAKVGDVTADADDTRVRLLHQGKPVAEAPRNGATGLVLHRWDAADKHAAPVSHPL